jgi:hypothetical protein
MKLLLNFFSKSSLAIFIISASSFTAAEAEEHGLRNLKDGMDKVLSAQGGLQEHRGLETSRPLSDFLDRQGTYCLNHDFSGGHYVDGLAAEPECLLFNPPEPNILGSTKADSATGNTNALIDYLGLQDRWIQENCEGVPPFGMRFTGGITEEPLPDGTSRVHISITSKNTLSWFVDNPITGTAVDPLDFGARMLDVCDGDTPVLGQSHVNIAFTNVSPGYDLPDLLQLLIIPEEGQGLETYILVANAKDKTGSIHVTQTYLANNPNCGRPELNGHGVGDCFPGELAFLKGH